MITVKELITNLLDCNMDALVLYKEDNGEIFPVDLYGYGGPTQDEPITGKTCASVVFQANEEDKNLLRGNTEENIEGTIY